MKAVKKSAVVEAPLEIGDLERGKRFKSRVRLAPFEMQGVSEG